MTKITKVAQVQCAYKRSFYYYPNARSAFKAYLESLRFAKDESILLPAYIGYSPKEGSGVFDPIRELGLNYTLYRVDEDLRIDLTHVAELLNSKVIKAVLVIHYFGFVDPSYQQLVNLAREKGVIVIEDEAHALFTDLVGGISGRLGDASFYSLHKMLPMKEGGVLCLNNCENTNLKSDSNIQSEVNIKLKNFLEYDHVKIAAHRLKIAHKLSNVIGTNFEDIAPLYITIQPGEIPQTYPIKVLNVSRDLLYELMNEKGYGVVSLYHTLVDEIRADEFPAAHRLSRTILNLPVHQDVKLELIEPMIDTLVECIRQLKKQ